MKSSYRLIPILILMFSLWPIFCYGEIFKSNFGKTDTTSKDETKGQDASRLGSQTNVTVSVIKAVVAAGVIDRKPASVGDQFLSNIGKLHFFTQIDATGWNSTGESYISHVWYYKNEQVSLIKLKIGGKLWRTYSTKSIPLDAVGEWRVEAVDQAGNILAGHTFNIIGQAG